MSSVAIHRHSPEARGGTVPRVPAVAAVLIVIVTAMFITEHQLDISLREHYTDTLLEMEDATEGGNTARRLAYLFLAAGGVIAGWIAAAPRPRICGVLGVAVLSLMAWCALSVLWSVDRGMTIRRLIVLACCFVAACGFSRFLRPRELCSLAMAVSLTFLVIGILTEIALGTFKPLSATYRFAGTVHPNTQGLYLATLCLSSSTLAASSKRSAFLLWGIFLFGMLFLILTKSRTSLAGTLLGFAGILSLRTTPGVRWMLAMGAVWTVGLVLFGAALAEFDLDRKLGQIMLLGREEQAESLTGRIPIWTEVSRFVAARPILGYGYEAFWNPDNILLVSRAMQWSIRESHNAWFDTTLCVGVIGLALLVTTVISGIGAAVRRYRQTGEAGYVFFAGLFIYAIVNCFLESGMVTPMCVPLIAGCGFCMLSFRPVTAGEFVSQPVRLPPTRNRRRHQRWAGVAAEADRTYEGTRR